ncbi:copper-binding protein [Hankyongella ginsenosidimutans]|uniref:Copper-binding protein n=1 Tax=Hankyongella ginsenosidimutans TaxID=1763828 RepID=A0A4D7C8A8_9SPHN|nr:copper-binding protein [Hankyongella ginsenosidimutans]QCI78827.1 copper-binding protein [Hankyongella ginsenosidimutans]
MKTLPLSIAALSILGLSACGQQAAPANKGEATAGAGMANMTMPAGPKQAQSTGIVTAIDKAGRKITLDHQPIPAVGWPAMTMAFAAKPAILNEVRVGDHVAFDVTVTGSAGEVTALRKQ